MRLEQSRLAQADIDAILEYGLRQFGPESALGYLDQIEQRYRQLLAFPRSGRIEPDLTGSVHSISCEAHRIYYEITGDMIVILRILHKSADVQRWLR